jgi:predicted TIM-barrel fold metal-dependent hydrolase
MASLQVELQLGPVEGALARQHLHSTSAMPAAGGALQLGLGDVPDLVRAEPLVGAQRQLHGVQLQAAVAVDALQQPDELRRLLLDLVLAAEDVGVVLGEGAHPEDAVQGAGRLIAVAGAELGHAQRQVAVALLAVVEDLHVARAVHRLDGQDLALDRLAREHVLAELLPVAGALPQLAVQHLGRLDLDVAVGVQPAAHVGLHRAVQRPALGVPEDHPLGLFLHVEEVHGRPILRWSRFSASSRRWR